MKTNLKKLICIVLAAAMIFGLVGCSAPTAQSAQGYKAGTYTAEAQGKNDKVKVEVEFSADKIVSVKVVEHKETEGISDPAIEKIPAAVVDKQTLAVNTVAGATFTSKAILEAVKDCVKQAGGNPDSMQNAGSTGESKVIEKETDIAVVGAGAAGMMAAFNATKNGIKVIVLEKGASPAVSNFAVAGGPIASETSIQAAENATVTNEQLYNHMYDFADANVNSALLKNVLERTGQSIETMKNLGIEIYLRADAYGMGFRARHGIKVKGMDRVGPIEDAIVKQGGEFLFETAGEKLITDDKGTVVGVEAKQSDGTIVKIKAKAVLVATGGFLGSKEMLAKYFPGANVVPLGNTLSTGDGINMVLGAGGVMDRNFALLGNEFGAANSKTGVPVYQGKEISNQNLCYWLYGGLMVNGEGQRFVNEGKIADLPLSIGGEIIAREGKVYAVLDEEYIKAVATEGAYKYLGSPEKWLAGKVLRYPVLDKAESQIQEAIDQGWAFKADSLEELAMVSGLTNLAETVKNYNELCAKGEDTQFGKSDYFLKSIDKGPYYVFEYEPSAWATNGGVKVDYKLRALNGENKPISGLFVAGSDAGSMFTTPYYDNEGSSFGLSLGSGVYAAETMAEYIKK